MRVMNGDIRDFDDDPAVRALAKSFVLMAAPYNHPQTVVALIRATWASMMGMIYEGDLAQGKAGAELNRVACLLLARELVTKIEEADVAQMITHALAASKPPHTGS